MRARIQNLNFASPWARGCMWLCSDVPWSKSSGLALRIPMPHRPLPPARPVRPDSRADAVRAPISRVRRSDDGVRVSSRGSPVRPVRAGEGAVSEASTGAFDPIARLPRHQTSRSRSYPSETRPGPICVSSRGPRPIVGKMMGPTSDFTSSSVLATSTRRRMHARVDDTSQRWATSGTTRPGPLGHAIFHKRFLTANVPNAARPDPRSETPNLLVMPHAL